MPLPDPLITVDPKRQGGIPVFSGTRVPVQTLFDHLEAGDPLDVFLDPNVTREHATAVLKASKAAVILRAIEQEPYEATADELAALDEALEQIKSGKRASDGEVEAVYARFRK
ncbi:MAG: DUF433 domain-containing protein [Rhodomicrobium sp.]